MELDKNDIKFDGRGLIPVVVQDMTSKDVLMVAYMNREALEKTITTGKATFWSRSRNKIWVKGESSGNYQYVQEIRIDCDEDTILLLVNPAGPACHTGNKTCFYRKLKSALNSANGEAGERDKASDDFLQKAAILKELMTVIADRKVNPQEGSYTSYLFQKGIDKICKKVGEEAAEVIIGAKNGVEKEIIYETADLFYHLLVLLNCKQIPLEKVFAELEGRRKAE